MKAQEEDRSSDDKSERTLGSHEDTDPDEEDDYIDDLPEVKANVKTKPRASVSAEAFGSWNKKKAFEPKKFAKTPEQETAIRDKLNMAFMFSALDENEKDIVIAAMEEKVAQPKEYVITQGEEGDCLFVIG